MASQRQLCLALVQYALMMVHYAQPAAGVNFHDKAQELKPVGILRREAASIQLDSKAQALKSHVLGLSAALDALEAQIAQTPNVTETAGANGSTSTAVTRTNGSADASSSNVTPGSNTSGIPMDTSNSTSTSVTNTDDSNSSDATPAAVTVTSPPTTDKSVVGPDGKVENERTHEVIDRSVAGNVSRSDKTASTGSRQNDSWNATTDSSNEKDKTGPDPLANVTR